MIKLAKNLRLALSNFDIQSYYGNSSEIDYAEFLSELRGKIDSKRASLVKAIFNFLSRGRCDQIDKTELKNRFNSSVHPDVLSGRKTEDEIYMEFSETIDILHNYYLEREETRNAQYIAEDEFVEYYENISFYIKDYITFSKLLTSVWGYSERSQERPQKTLMRSNSSSSLGQSRRPFNDLQLSDSDPSQMLRAELVKKGLVVFVNFIKKLKSASVSNDQIDVANFEKALLNSQLYHITKTQVRSLFNYFDTEKEGYINIDTVIQAIIAPMNDKRKSCVEKIFDSLDTQNQGAVSLNVLLKNYDSMNHPKVKSRKSSSEKEYSNFIETLNSFHYIFNQQNIISPVVSKDEFIQYYNIVSTFYDNDNDFLTLIKKVWNFNEDTQEEREESQSTQGSRQRKSSAVPYRNGQAIENPQKGTFNPLYRYRIDDVPHRHFRSKQSSQVQQNSQSSVQETKPKEAALKKLQKILVSRESRGIMGLRRSLMITCDTSKNITLANFLSLIEEYRIDLTEEEAIEIYQGIDYKNKNKINYQLLIDTIVPPLKGERRELAMEVFGDLSEGNEKVPLDTIRRRFNPKNHPEVKEGKKSSEVILAEFLDNYEYHFFLLSDETRSKENVINLAQFLDFYKYLSFPIEKDSSFFSIMNSVWE